MSSPCRSLSESLSKRGTKRVAEQVGPLHFRVRLEFYPQEGTLSSLTCKVFP